MLRRKLRRLRIRLGPDGKEILRLHDGVEGLLAVEESAFLFHSARGRRTIVEIGSYRGKSCVLLGRGSRACGAPGAHVTAIDPHGINHAGDRTRFSDEDARKFDENVRREGLAEDVDHWIMTSRDALPKWQAGNRAIDMLWIDGDHSYEAVRFDLSAWTPLVAPGGMVAAHDYAHRGDVKRAWDEVMSDPDRWEPTRFVRSIAWTVRRS